MSNNGSKLMLLFLVFCEAPLMTQTRGKFFSFFFLFWPKRTYNDLKKLALNKKECLTYGSINLAFCKCTDIIYHENSSFINNRKNIQLR